MSTLVGKVNTLGDRVLGHAYAEATGCPLCQLPSLTLLPPARTEKKSENGLWTRGIGHRPGESLMVMGWRWIRTGQAKLHGE